MTPIPQDAFPEFPIVADVRTYGSVFREWRAVLHDFAGKMTRDRSYDHAKTAIAISEGLGEILDDNWIDDLSIRWEPTDE